MLFLIYDMCRADGIIEASKQNINQSAFRQLPHRYLGKTMPNCDTRTVSALMAYLVGCPYIDLCAPNTHMFKDKTIHTLLYTYAITHPDCKTS
jgi:hypothetical protein